MNKKVNPFDHAREILESLPGGLLLTTAHDGTVNTMTIGWGALGTDWNKPVFITLVRESRFTRELLDKNPEFTVNIHTVNSTERYSESAAANPAEIPTR